VRGHALALGHAHVDHRAGHGGGDAAVGSGGGSAGSRGCFDLERQELRGRGQVEPPAPAPTVRYRTRRCAERREPREKPGRQLPAAERGVRDEPAEKGEVRRHSLDDRLVEGSCKKVERGVAVVRMRDELRDHRVVAGAHLVPLGDPRVDANELREREPRDPPVLREERPRVLGVEPRLDGVTLRSGLESGEPLAVRDAQLQLDQIEPGHRLGHRVLDLDPRVQLEEEDLVSVDEELRRSRALVPELGREGDRVGGEPLAHAVR